MILESVLVREVLCTIIFNVTLLGTVLLGFGSVTRQNLELPGRHGLWVAYGGSFG